ncbi:nucleoporin GLE1 [Solea senegalensis]|uniref:mRNA export factor GLE1 n=2 Tax=Solea senegalensis TaxID=28829 RepID=A0AAV6QHH5_SOLSE|nr:nucleoporin GLE1 isoform X1 [Solea senegalensis]KAG7490961.1 nucleoporin GLE1 [Solea senegalensis]
MPSESLRWETLEALKNSPKGKISFDPHWSERDENIMVGCKETICLSSHSGILLERLSSSTLQKSFCLDSISGYSSPGLSEEIPASFSSTGSVSDTNRRQNTHSNGLSGKTEHEQVVSDEVKDEDPDMDVGEVSSPASSSAISLLSPKAMEVAGRIIKFEEEHREKAKMALRRRQEQQEKLVAAAASSESEQLKRFEEFMELKQRQEFQSMRDMMERETKESIGRQEKLKEEQRYRMKILNLRVREAELQRQREAELERQRQTEGKERLRNLNTIQEEVLQLNLLLEPTTQTRSDLPPSSLSSYSSRGNQLCSQVSEVVRKTTEGAFPSVEDMTVAERALHEMRALIRLMQEAVARVQEEKKKKEEEEEDARRKQAELQVQQEEQKKAAQSAKEKAQRRGLQNSAEDSTLKWYKNLQESAARCAESFENLNTPKDNATKKLKLELQKAATIPVSQIASDSGSQLREIFDKMDKLLSGQAVVSSGKSVSTSQHPQGLEFISYKLAEKFVKQGEEEVASHHEAAFPIAVVASGVWERHPRVGDLILAHLHKKCPYAVPHYPPMKEGTSVEAYQRILGYRVDDGGMEGQDSFLKRMSGMIRLYAAIIQLRWPYGSKQAPLPHGLNHGWRWLAQMLNMEPLADITATLLFDFLEVCGHALMKQYQAQFWKLLLLVREEYFPRIEAVTSSGQMGSVIRLKQFLETSLHSRQIPPPKGQLTSTFWRS